MADDAAVRALELRLGRLEDERAILQTMYAYGHSIDYGDEELFLSCWTEDAVLHWPWREPIVGHEALTAAFRRHTHAPGTYHKHFMVEPRVWIDGGDDARAISLYARLDRDGDERPYLRSFGRYVDRLTRGGDGRWRFRERRAENEAHVTRGTI